MCYTHYPSEYILYISLKNEERTGTDIREVIYYIDYPKERRPAALAMTHADITFFFLRPSFGVIICEADRQSTNTRNGTSQCNIIPFVWGNVYNTLPHGSFLI